MPKTLNLREANELEIVAIAGAFKETAIKASKSKLIEGEISSVNFLCQIVGSITKSVAIAGELVAPEVDLTNLATMVALLHRLGIGEKRLRAALLEVGPCFQSDEPDTLATVFTEVAREIAGTLPQIMKSVSPRVTSVLSARVVAE